MLTKLRSQSGAAMIMALFAAAVLSLLGLALAEMTRAHLLLAIAERQSLQALDLAEAGLDRALSELWSDPAWSGLNGGSLAGVDGTFAVTVAQDPGPPIRRIVTSTGTYGRIQRTVRGQVAVMDQLGSDFALALRSSLWWSGGTLSVTGGTQIDGDLRTIFSPAYFAGSTVLSGHLYDTFRRVVSNPPIVQSGAMLPLAESKPQAYHNPPFDLLDTDYPGGTTLKGSNTNHDPEVFSGQFRIMHIEGSGTLETVSVGSTTKNPVPLIIVVADGDLVVSRKLQLHEGVTAIIIAGGDITVDGDLHLESTTLMAGGDLVLLGDLVLEGDVVANTITAGGNSLSIQQRSGPPIKFPVALQVSLLTWEEVTAP